MKSKIKYLLFLFILGICCFPLSIKAVSIKHNTIWTASDGLGLSDQTYYTNGYGERHTKYLGGWNLTSGSNTRLFCVEPGAAFPTNGTVSGYSETSTVPDGRWDISGDVTHLEKVFSCFYNNDTSVMATQAIVWELVSEERTNLDASKILSGDYTPYMADGSVYGSRAGITSLYERIRQHSNLLSAYQSVLRCAARFNVTPSFAKTSDSSARSSAQILTNYDDETQTFSRTFTHSSSITNAKNILKFYKVSSSDSSVKVTKTDTSITVSTSKELAEKSDAVKITLTYAYKDNGTSELNDFGSMKYYVKDEYQSLAMGSTTKTVYLYVYTGEKPTYQLRVRKVDEDGNPMSGVKFNVYSDSALTKKVGTTSESDSNGYAVYKGLNKIGKYYVQEADTPDGYVTNKEVMTVDVSGSDREGSNNYATASSSFVNEYMHLSLSKKTIDSNGDVIDVKDYTENSCTGDYIGPVFTLSKNGKDIYVTQTSAGNYKLSSSTSQGATNELRTCNGKFDIEQIESGTYELTEIEAPDGYTLPENPTQTITVTKGQDAVAAVMYNGVTGVVFNKISENGELIDGGKYALQQRVNGVYHDMLLKKEEGVYYSYVEDLTEEDEGATYILETTNGTINVRNLPPGEYRFVEKQAPEGYDIIKDKDSNATFTISDKGIFGDDGDPVTDYYQVKLVNQKTRVSGSYDQAELIVTIITGRKVANYTLIIAGLAVLLTVLIILRKKFKK